MSSALYGGGILRECHYGNMIYFKAKAEKKKKKKKEPFTLNVLNRDTQLSTKHTFTVQCVINLVNVEEEEMVTMVTLM